MFKITLQDHFKEYQLGVNDCWTLIIDIMAENGITIPNEPSINTAFKRENFKKDVLDNVNYIELDKPQRGAVLLFKGNPVHCGVCINEKEFIHRDEGIGTRIERIKDYARPKGIYLATRKNT